MHVPDKTPTVDPYLRIDVNDLASAYTWLRSLYGPLALETSAEGFAWSARVAKLGPIALVQGVCDASSPVHLAVEPGAHVINLLTSGSARAGVGRERAEIALGQGVAVCSPGTTVEWTSAGGFRSNNVRVDPAFLAAQLEALTGEQVAESPVFSLQMRTGGGAGAHLERLLFFLSDEVARGTPIEHPVLVNNLCEAVARALLLGQPHDLAHLLERPAPPSSRSAVRRVEELVEAHAGEPIRARDLAALTGASTAALDAAFWKHRGTTTAAFVRERRLAQARRTLLSEPEVPVMRVVHAAGFLRTERFEAAYVQAFHETPAETRSRGLIASRALSPAVAEEHAALSARLASLTPREREVCARVARGMLNKQIAAELEISVGMVERHRGRAMKKLGASGAAELGRLWAKMGG
ncbi:LuxR C-terminal-related transcriptional regulator [Sorangium sp. So ce131]|uniref:AraC-like ligand-binding domain-containing protein n=1 Tax=Sorangium sp. So ce131 TaxID=3133282 RepID=UPI003F6281A9